MTQKANAVEQVGSREITYMTIQKSTPLLSLWRSDMALSEFKILDAYLSRINSHEPEKRTVVFTKGELEQLLGVTKINRKELQGRISRLGRFVDLEEGNPKKIHQVALFEEAYGEQDENGQWTVRLTCTPSAMKYVFDIEHLGYLHYKLKSVASLTSRFSYILFLYLEQNRFRKSWVVSLDELRMTLNCNDKSYEDARYFIQRVLKKSQAELQEKTSCDFTYTTIRTGRSITAIQFCLKTKSDDEFYPGIPEGEDLEALPESDTPPEKPNALYADALPDCLTDAEVEALRLMATTKVNYDLGGIWPQEILIADYLRLKVCQMNACNNTVRHPYAYLKAMIEKDPDIF